MYLKKYQGVCKRYRGTGVLKGNTLRCGQSNKKYLRISRAPRNTHGTQRYRGIERYHNPRVL